MFTKEKIYEYADKLLIGLSEEENEMVLKEFDAIDESIDLINKIEGISEVEPMTHCLDDFEYVLRDDIVEESPSIEELIQNSDETTEREIVVPKVVG